MEAIRKFTVSRNDAMHEGWPDIVRTRSGRLLCVFSECEAHACRDNCRIMLIESDDDGATWKNRRPLTELTQKEDFYNCARLSLLADGTIAAVCDRIQGDENRAACQYLWTSTDDGESWSDAAVLPFTGIVPDKITTLSTGRILLAAHFKNHETGKLEQYLWYSDDGMKTWSDRVTVAADPRYNLCEVSIYECTDGTLAALMRENSNMGRDCFKTLSTDGGESWSEVYPTNMPGCHRPVAGRLTDGRVLISYRYHAGYGSWATNTFLTLTDEESLKHPGREGNYRIIPLDYDRAPRSDGGYTGWVQLPDGDVLLVNYITDDAPKAQIRGYRFDPNKLILQ